MSVFKQSLYQHWYSIGIYIIGILTLNAVLKLSVSDTTFSSNPFITIYTYRHYE